MASIYKPRNTRITPKTFDLRLPLRVFRVFRGLPAAGFDFSVTNFSVKNRRGLVLAKPGSGFLNQPRAPAIQYGRGAFSFLV